MKISSLTHDTKHQASQLALGLSCLGAIDLRLTRRLATFLSPVVILVVIILDPGGVR